MARPGDIQVDMQIDIQADMQADMQVDDLSPALVMAMAIMAARLTMLRYFHPDP